MGGTLFELIVPLACAIYFFFRREPTGTAFCAFWFFENFLYIGAYMADARAQQLPLVTVGDSDYVELCLATPLDIKIDGDSDGWTIVTAT